ncbi:AAA family ATPase [Tumebacillus flagellatus]|uniref:ATPase AAA-type core domain-containing protein n=1 Tax=Tumebacillus flagellatus TaxID=1157490 RepID=A0A074LQH1_9BACL|nr:ATP-binding protein [Tumebacillus flagellatus]KEO83354.1 hypothetical protein EL26_10275 [Tumebacillus flagellatus]
MKLRRAYLQGVKGIGELEIDFVDPVKNKVRDRNVIVGKNGSGKTTFLESVFTVVSLLETKHAGIESADQSIFSPARATLQLEISVSELQTKQVELATGGRRSPDLSQEVAWVSFDNELGAPGFSYNLSGRDLLSLITDAVSGLDDDLNIGNLLYFPTNRNSRFDLEGEISNEAPQFRWAYRYNQEHSEWKGSLESYLVWEFHKNLRDRRKNPTAPSKFQEFADLVNRFLEGKAITDVGDDYRVEVTDLTTQKTMTLDALSSGEKQIVLFIGEILRNIREGSLILIDEPELHLHPVWQKIFVSTLTNLCQSKNAQFILTTQSPAIADSVLPSEVVELDDLLRESTS